MTIDKYIGHLRKMHVHYINQQEPVVYSLLLDDKQIPLNPLLGKKITLNFSGNIHCIACGRKTSKSFNQGYCFP